jgi:hypothetical protein
VASSESEDPAPERTVAPTDEPAPPEQPLAERHAQGMVPGRPRRGTAVERVTMRVVATAGVVAIGTALGAILVSQDVAGWIVGLVVSLVSVLIAAILWSSREL